MTVAETHTADPTAPAFRSDATAFLDGRVKRRRERIQAWGEGSDRMGIFPELVGEDDRRRIEASRLWRRAMFDAGFGWITGPAEYGGRALPASYQTIWDNLVREYDTPSEAAFSIGLGMVAPTILLHGTEEVKRAYLRKLWRGDIIACQLFSEPGAGSDLAGLQTRAARDGDDWIIHGQKVWTSGAHHADIGEILCRTDHHSPKHNGITGFVVDMHAPGVEVRPLRQMTGGASFNEVFFTDVRVSDSHRLGDINKGWSVALTTLMNERAAIGGSSRGGVASIGPEPFIELVRHIGRASDATIRQQLADLYINLTVARYTHIRATERVQAGQLPGPEMSIAKLALTNNLTRMSALVSRVLGPLLIADTGAWGTYCWSEFTLSTPGVRIAGGTDEVMKNIVAERVLGLPKEPSPASVGRNRPGQQR